MNEDSKNEEMNDFMRGLLEEFARKPGKKDSLAEVAEVVYGQYQAFKVAGFDDEQAFKLVGLILSSIIARM